MTSVAQSKVPHVHMLVCGGEPPGAKESLSIRARGELTMPVNANDGDTVTLDTGFGAVVFEFDTVAFATGSVTIAVGNAVEGDLVTLIDALGVTAIFEFDQAFFAAGDLTIAVGNASIGDLVTLIDALGGTETFEFESGGGVDPANISVTIGGTNALSAAALAAAVTASSLDMTAVDTTNVVDFTQLTAGTSGNTVITETGTDISKTDFAGGTDLSVTAGNISVLVGADDDASAANLSTAINAQQTLDITAVPTLGVVDLTQGTAGAAGNTAIVETGGDISKVDFTGGEDLVAAGNNIAVLVGVDAPESIDNLTAAINGSGVAIKARLDDVSGDNDILLEHIGGGTVANVAILESTSGARIVATGMLGGTDTRAGIIERCGDSQAANPLLGMIQNDSEVQVMTLTIQDSPDNLRAGFDAGSDKTFRVNGADVTSIAVQPRGRILFIVEGFAALDKFLRFSLAPEGSTNGTITLTYWHGDIVRRDREDDAP